MDSNMKLAHGKSIFGSPEVYCDGKRISHYYMDRSTGEITESHAEAVQWYRDGHEVEVWHNDRMAIAWVF